MKINVTEEGIAREDCIMLLRMIGSDLPNYVRLRKKYQRLTYVFFVSLMIISILEYVGILAGNNIWLRAILVLITLICYGLDMLFSDNIDRCRNVLKKLNKLTEDDYCINKIAEMIKLIEIK